MCKLLGKVKMIIRNATLRDINFVSQITEEFNRNRNSTKNGFVEYPLIATSGWEERIKENPYFYIFEKNSLPIGFSAAYSKDKLLNKSFEDDEIVKDLLGSSQQFIYWDQLVVLKEFQGNGLARESSNRFIEDIIRSQFETCYVAVCHKPHKNSKSSNLVCSFGFKLEKEIQVYNGLEFGVYKKKINH